MIEENIQPPATPTRPMSAPQASTTNKTLVLANSHVTRCPDCSNVLVDGDCPDCNKVINL
jgi:hypothetical protein